MSLLFKAKTNEGMVFKILFELLKSVIIKDVTLEIKHDGIYLKTSDSNNHMLIYTYLAARNFHEYELNTVDILHLGIRSKDIYSVLKNIKKQDFIVLYIEEEDPGNLCIDITPENNKRVSKTRIRVHTLQQINILLPPQGSKYLIIQSNDYQKMIKDLTSGIGNEKKLTISMSLKAIKLKVHNDIIPREMILGDLNDTTDIYYSATFNMELFSRIAKIANIGNRIHIFSGSSTEPLSIETKVGALGDLKIYIKSNDQL